MSKTDNGVHARNDHQCHSECAHARVEELEELLRQWRKVAQKMDVISARVLLSDIDAVLGEERAFEPKTEWGKWMLEIDQKTKQWARIPPSTRFTKKHD